MEFKERVKALLDEKELTQSQVCKLSGITQAYMSMVMSGKRNPNNKLLATLSALSGKSMDWWETGEEKEDKSLSALKTMIDLFFKEGYINKNGMDEEYRTMLHTMLDKCIEVEIDKRYNK